jgi:thioredoxin 1
LDELIWLSLQWYGNCQLNKPGSIGVIFYQKRKIMLEHLTKESFKEKVFNFEENKGWKYEGSKPCLIDFYADWCGPCKMVAPILEELQKEYGDSLVIYKVNTEEQQELAGMFGIQSIPSLLFIPLEGQPQMALGALPKNTFEKAISDVLKVEKPFLN